MQRIILVIIILIAIVLRFVGTNPGYPPIHEDEGITHSQGIAMLLEHSLNPQNGYGLPYNYPIIVPLINAIFYGVIFIPMWTLGYLFFHFPEVASAIINGHFSQVGGIFEQNILGLGKINVVFWGRYVTAFFGVLVVWLSYKFGKRLFRSDLVGILGAFFVAINYRQVLNSHFGLPDIYNAFFLLFSLYQINRLWEKPVAKNYLLAGFSVSVYFSTKFQFFALPPLVLVLFFLVLQHKKRLSWVKNNLKNNFPLLLLALLVTAIGLNIFHLLHWQETLEQVGYSALKYRSSRMQLDFYPISYLYHIGIGQVTSILSLIGIILGFVYKFKQTFFLLSVVVPFVLAMVYVTGGGFYTRNFVTIIPILLIFSALAIFQLKEIVKRYSKIGSFLICFLMIVFVGKEMQTNSLMVPWEYSQSWNTKILQRWLGQNLLGGSVVIADSRIPISSQKVKVIEAESVNSYFLADLQNQGINYAVINLNSFQDNFFWWMLGNTEETLNFWHKPTAILNNTPLAKMIFELKKYVVFEVLNPWQAPDENFLVIHIPEKKEFDQGQTVYTSNFERNDWFIVNDGFGDLKNLYLDRDIGFNQKGALKISLSDKGKYSQRFVSPLISAEGGYLYRVNGQILSSGVEQNGLIGIEFLSEKEELVDIALSGKIGNTSGWSMTEIVAMAPLNTKFFRLFFQSLSSETILWLDDIEVWQSVKKATLDEGLYVHSRYKPDEHLFLNSNGGM